jgi:hypothetical protein
MFQIYAFKAIDKPDACHEFVRGHAEVLTSYGITKLTSLDYSWLDDPNVYVIAVTDMLSNEMVAGGRIHLTDLRLRTALPLETALASFGDGVSLFVDQNLEVTKKKTAETCALWSAKKASGKGLGALVCRAMVVRAGVVIANQLGIGTLLTLSAPWTVKLSQDLGYRVENSVGNKGTFPYPKPDLLATLQKIIDIDALAYATETSRQDIYSLRRNPVQQKLETYRSGRFKISYNLEL